MGNIEYGKDFEDEGKVDKGLAILFFLFFAVAGFALTYFMKL